MRTTLFFSLLLVCGAALADTTRIEFRDGWIKQLPPVIPMRAGYLQIENKSAQAHQIVSLQSSLFERVEIHETLLQDGVMKMVQLDDIPIPAQGKVELKPGAKHLMLIEPRQALQTGERVELTATFEDGSAQVIQLEIRK